MLIIPALVFLLVNLTACAGTQPKLSEPVKVVRVIDGDTIETSIQGTLKTIRLIGVDTPESVNPDETKNTEEGRIVSEYVKELLTGKEVSLEKDKDLQDDYGRELRYVYLGDEMIQEKLLKQGYARCMEVKPNTKYASRFKLLEQAAKKEKRGFWN